MYAIAGPAEQGRVRCLAAEPQGDGSARGVAFDLAAGELARAGVLHAFTPVCVRRDGRGRIIVDVDATEELADEAAGPPRFDRPPPPMTLWGDGRALLERIAGVAVRA